MMEEINLLDYNLCTYSECDCGGNITIGAKRKTMRKVVLYLKKNFKIKLITKDKQDQDKILEKWQRTIEEKK